MMLLHSINKKNARSNERGAALITTLMIATLVLAAGGALVLTTGMSATNSIDATAEMQAYYGAEAGLQQALNVLRGNVASHDVVGTPKMSFRNAVTADKSNMSGDAATATRFSGWLVYNYTSTDSAFVDRVKVSPTDNTYTPLTGIAFGLTVTDPDSTPVADGEPTRLVIKSIGYGPKGATKRLEMVVQRNGINFSVPAAITVVGTSPMTFSLGNSNASGYTGNDSASTPLAGVSAVAVSAGNTTQTQTTIDSLNAQGGGTQVMPSTALTLNASNTPPFLASADATRLFLVTARDIASGEGRYFTTGDAAVAAGLGTSVSPFTTVVDNFGGDAMVLGSGYQGCGLLIVTGDLITQGSTDFEGVILVLGGSFNRNGNGNGHIDGGIIVASLDPRPTATTGFGAPTFSVNGAGNSDVRYNSTAVRKAFDSTGASVAGVHEY
jgi:Tfp pilus assembly protein PilX